jgi:Pyridoxal-phosphate dependent enzyme
MTHGNRAMGPPPATRPTPTSHCDKSAFSRLAKLMSQASASSLPFPVARPRISAIEMNGARQAHQDVRPCLQAGRTLRDAARRLVGYSAVVPADARPAPVVLGTWPTPLEPAPRLAAAVGLAADALWVKRDDLSGLGGGGNKVRKLQYTCAQALAVGATTLITSGAPQSNHARLTAAAAARLGLRSVLVLQGQEPRQAVLPRRCPRRAAESARHRLRREAPGT